MIFWLGLPDGWPERQSSRVAGEANAAPEWAGIVDTGGRYDAFEPAQDPGSGWRATTCGNGGRAPKSILPSPLHFARVTLFGIDQWKTLKRKAKIWSLFDQAWALPKINSPAGSVLDELPNAIEKSRLGKQLGRVVLRHRHTLLAHKMGAANVSRVVFSLMAMG